MQETRDPVVPEPVYPHRRSGAGLFRKITRLRPFQPLDKRSNAVGPPGDLEYQVPDLKQRHAKVARIRVKSGLNSSALIRVQHPVTILRSAPIPSQVESGSVFG